MNKGQDILEIKKEELRQQPFKAPRGYLEEFSVHPRKVSRVMRFSPYLALAAASVALAVVVGTAVFGGSVQQNTSEEASQYETYVDMDLIPHTADVDMLCYSMSMEDDALARTSLQYSLSE